ncbi:MAG: tRNA pseudouridine(55) synthase TruB [Chloroflexi bacterium]|nr:tRNA pseudouridine(55) synthase TruB [Chloroflexota bacterium]MCL5075420.1 tRNA pseudouridine(55) synthase TruB [Chloroflexota bacterium]
MDGIFNINKPAGLTSFDAVAAVRRFSGQRRVGHAGTLDPLAEGVLLICLGKATRVVEYLARARKIYCAEIYLGVSTDTFDALGRVVAVCEVEVGQDEVEKVLRSLVGKRCQVPPMYSAIKRGGVPLYKLARAGKEVEREPREVEIYAIRLINWQRPLLRIALECSKGTYVRSIAQEIGERLGCGAHLSHLSRLAVGHFTIDDSIPLADLEDAFLQEYWSSLIYPLDEGLLDHDAVILSAESERVVKNGRPWGPKSGPSKGHSYDEIGPCRAYTASGEMIAVLEFDPRGQHWLSQKVFV